MIRIVFLMYISICTTCADLESASTPHFPATNIHNFYTAIDCVSSSLIGNASSKYPIFLLLMLICLVHSSFVEKRTLGKLPMQEQICYLKIVHNRINNRVTGSRIQSLVDKQKVVTSAMLSVGLAGRRTDRQKERVRGSWTGLQTDK